MGCRASDSAVQGERYPFLGVIEARLIIEDGRSHLTLQPVATNQKKTRSHGESKEDQNSTSAITGLPSKPAQYTHNKAHEE